MFLESDQSRKLEREDWREKAEKVLPEKLVELEKISQELKDGGFCLDEKCRILEVGFDDIFRKKEIEKDRKKVASLEKKFSNQEKIGELLEVVKTLVFNSDWFGQDLITLRTSKFDDYFNGVDEVIIDTKTGETLAAVDTTTDVKEKLKNIIDKVRNGSEVKYGLSLSENGIDKKILKKLPTFIISLTPEELIQLAHKESSEILKDKTIQSLLEQSKGFQETASLKMKPAYKRAENIFERLASY